MGAEKGRTSVTVPGFDLGRRGRLEEVLEALCYPLGEAPQHAVLHARGEGVRITLYRSGKLLIQGKRTEEVHAELSAFGLIRTPLPPGKAGSRGVAAAATSSPVTGPTMGSDETGKGDYFGRLVVAACGVDAETAPKLEAMGVQDSKALSDRRAHALARKIRALCPFEIVSITPKRYNELYERFQNLNHLLAWCHGKAVKGLLERFPARLIIVDRFTENEGLVARAIGEREEGVELLQRVRGEEELPVAAASVLARSAFLSTLDELSARFGIELPKGASAKVIAAGRRFVVEHGREALAEVAKLHFKTSARVLAG